jgi:dUTPase
VFIDHAGIVEGIRRLCIRLIRRLGRFRRFGGHNRMRRIGLHRLHRRCRRIRRCRLRIRVRPRLRVRVRPGLRIRIRTRLGIRIRTRLGIRVRTRLGIRVRPRLGIRVRPRLGIRIRTRLRIRIRTRLGIRVRPRLGIRIRTRLGIRVRPGLGIRVRTGLRVRVRPGLGIRIRTRLRIRVRPGLGIRIRTRLRIRIRTRLGVRVRTGLGIRVRSRPGRCRPRCRLRRYRGIRAGTIGSRDRRSSRCAGTGSVTAAAAYAAVVFPPFGTTAPVVGAQLAETVHRVNQIAGAVVILADAAAVRSRSGDAGRSHFGQRLGNCDKGSVGQDKGRQNSVVTREKVHDGYRAAVQGKHEIIARARCFGLTRFKGQRAGGARNGFDRNIPALFRYGNIDDPAVRPGRRCLRHDVVPVVAGVLL